MTQYYVDAAGKYLGGFDGAEALKLVPPGATEVPGAPEDARQIWDGAKWGPVPAPPPKSAAPLTADELAEILIAKGAISQPDIAAKKAAR